MEQELIKVNSFIDLYLFKNCHLDIKRITYLEKMIPPSLKEYVSHYSDNVYKIQSLLCYLTLLQLHDELICFNENGCPYFPSNQIYFSISHNENDVILAVSKKPIGVDFIKCEKYDNYLKQFLTSDINASDEEIANIIASKEALIKLNQLNLTYLNIIKKDDEVLLYKNIDDKKIVIAYKI